MADNHQQPPRRTPTPSHRPPTGTGVDTPAQIFAAHHAAFPLPHHNSHSHNSSPSRTPTHTSLAHAPTTAHLLHPQMVRDGLERHLSALMMGPPPPPSGPGTRGPSPPTAVSSSSAPPSSSTASASASITTTHPLFPTPRSLPPFGSSNSSTPVPGPPPPSSINTNLNTRTPPPHSHPQQSHHSISPKMDLSNILRRDWVPPGPSSVSPTRHAENGGPSSSPLDRDRDRERDRERERERERERFRAIAPAPQQHQSSPPFVGAGGTAILSPSHVQQQQRQQEEARFSPPVPRRYHGDRDREREREDQGGFNINPHLNASQQQREREHIFPPPMQHMGMQMGPPEPSKVFREHGGYMGGREREGMRDEGYMEREREREWEREREREREREVRENTLPPLNILHPHSHSHSHGHTAPPPLLPHQQQQPQPPPHLHAHPGPPQHMPQRSPERDRLWNDHAPPPPPQLLQHQQQQHQQQREREQQAREQHHLEQQLTRERERFGGPFTISAPSHTHSPAPLPPLPAPPPRLPPMPALLPSLPHLGAFHRPLFPPPRVFAQVPATFDLLLEIPRVLPERENGWGERYLFGTGYYTDDSDPLLVALHAGQVSLGDIKRRTEQKGRGGEKKKVMKLRMRVSERRARYVGSVGGEGIESRTWADGHDGSSLECVGMEWVEGLTDLPHSLRLKLSASSHARILPLLFPTLLLSTRSPSHTRSEPYDWLSYREDGLGGRPKRRLVDVVRQAEGGRGVGGVGWEECVWGEEGRGGREGGAGVLGLWEKNGQGWMVYAPRDMDDLVAFAQEEPSRRRRKPARPVVPVPIHPETVSKRIASPPHDAPLSLPPLPRPATQRQPPPSLRTHNILLYPTPVPPSSDEEGFLLRLVPSKGIEVLGPGGTVLASPSDDVHWMADGLVRIGPPPARLLKRAKGDSEGDVDMSAGTGSAGRDDGRRRHEYRASGRAEMVCAVGCWRWVGKEEVLAAFEGAARGEGEMGAQAAHGGQEGTTDGPGATGRTAQGEAAPTPMIDSVPAAPLDAYTTKRKRMSDASVSSAEGPETPGPEADMGVPRKRAKVAEYGLESARVVPALA